MTILEGYFAKIDKYPEYELKLCISLKYPHFIKIGKMLHCPELAPSQELLDDYKDNKITWAQYTDRFREEMRHQTLSRRNLEWLKCAHARPDFKVRLLCYEKAEDKQCHRFLLLDVLISMEEE